MLALVIVYFLMFAAILMYDGLYIYFKTKNSLQLATEVNFMRYLKGVEMLVGLYSITVLSQVLASVDLVTTGFARNIAIILTMVALVIIFDFVHNEIKFKDYKLLFIKLSKKAIISNKNLSDIKFHLEDSYCQTDKIESCRKVLDELQKSTGDVNNNKISKKYLCNRLAVGAFMIIAMVACIIAMTMVKGG